MHSAFVLLNIPSSPPTFTGGFNLFRIVRCSEEKPAQFRSNLWYLFLPLFSLTLYLLSTEALAIVQLLLFLVLFDNV